MSKLIMTLDGVVVREYPIDKDSLSIGRKHGNDIQLNDLTVSGRHTLIATMENMFTWMTWEAPMVLCLTAHAWPKP